MPRARAGSLGLRLFAPVAASWPRAARQQDVRVHPGDESEPAGCVAYLGSLLSCIQCGPFIETETSVTQFKVASTVAFRALMRIPRGRGCVR